MPGWTKLGKFVWIVIVMSNCKDPYIPPVGSESIGYLSVDGNINATDGIATVKLTRTIQLNGSDIFPMVENASVTVEEEQGASYSMPYEGNGLYQVNTNFDLNKKYKLRIRLADGKNYSSSYIPLIDAPPIDSLWWEPSQDGVHIKLNAKSSLEASPFYSWRFTETWEYHSAIPSYLEIDNNNIVAPRYPTDQIFVCWRTLPSTQILIKSTESLTQNLVSQFQVDFLPLATEKLLQRYSTLVEQRAITQDYYNYLKLLQQTTQNVGGLFDPIPSKLIGNITNDDNSSEPVIGYFYGGTVSNKRIFIAFDQLPVELRKGPSALECPIIQVPIPNLPDRDKSWVIIGSYGIPATVGYTFAYPQCVDCTYRGGTTTRPSFW